LYDVFDVVKQSVCESDEASVSSAARSPALLPEVAQASQSAAAIWLTDDTASRVISEGAINHLNRSVATIHRFDQPSR
jgi:hypothetical protein